MDHYEFFEDDDDDETVDLIETQKRIMSSMFSLY